MVVITAAVPAERGALVINALQKVVDARKDEREAYYESLPAGESDAVAEAADADPADPDLADPDLAGAELAGAELVADPAAPESVDEDFAEPAVPEPVANDAANGSGEAPTAEKGQPPDGGAAGQPIATADVLRNVSAESECPAADVFGDVSAETTDLPTEVVFELSSTEQRYADALVDVAEHYLASGPSHRERRPGQRYEVVLTIDRNELAEQPPEGTRYQVDPDWGIDEEDARQIACDADLTEFVEDAQGNLLNYERRRRIVPAPLLRALKLRDHNRCRFPGCPHQRYVEAHHVQHWIDGGETRLENLVLLCSAHHRLLHHGAFHITVEERDVVFVSRDGEVIEPALRPQFPEVPAGVSEETPLPGPGTAVGTSLRGNAAIRRESSYAEWGHPRVASPDRRLRGIDSAAA